MKALMIFTIIGMLLLISCSESTKPDYEPFSLKVTLRDAAGNSLEGYRIAIFQEDLGIQDMKQNLRPASILLLIPQVW